MRDAVWDELRDSAGVLDSTVDLDESPNDLMSELAARGLLGVSRRREP